MANIRIFTSSTGAHVNRWSAGTITASSAASALPAAASQSTDRTAVWRSTTTAAAETLDLDAGASVAITCAAIANVRVKNAGTVALYEGGTAGSPGAWNLLGTFAAQNASTLMAYLYVTVTARHFRLQFNNGSGASDYAELGYAFIGTYYEPLKGVVMPVDMKAIDPALEGRSGGGQSTFSQIGRMYDVGRLQFQNMEDAEFEVLRQVFVSIGIRTPIFIVLTSTISWQAWLLRFTGEFQKPRVFSTFYSPAIAWKEAV
jgi:hypothetical protein